MKLNCFALYDELYQASIHIIVGATAKEAKELIQRQGYGGEFDFNSGDDEINRGFVWITPPKYISKTCAGFYLYWRGDAIDTLIHELYHLNCEILKERGLEPSEIINEAGAYHIGWLFREIDKLITKPKKRK